MPDTAAPASGLVHYYDPARDIHEFHIRDIKPATIDQWFTVLAPLEREAAASGTHILALYALYSVWPTPYAIKQVIALSRQSPPHLTSSTAVVIADASGIAFKIIQTLLRQLPAYGQQARRIFNTTAEAQAWLHERQTLTPERPTPTDSL